MTASAIAAPAGEATAPAALLVALCQDGTEWIGVAPPEATVLVVGSPLALLDAASSGLPSGCEGFVLVSPPGGVVPDPGDVGTEDAAVWSRGSQPAVRTSDTP